MPYATLMLTGKPPAAELMRALQRQTTEVLVERLGAARPLVAVRVVVDAPGTWSVGGEALAPDAAGVVAHICLAETTADDARIAGTIAALAALFKATLGGNALPPYVVVERIDAALWGYKGRTLARLTGACAT